MAASPAPVAPVMLLLARVAAVPVNPSTCAPRLPLSVTMLLSASMPPAVGKEQAHAPHPPDLVLTEGGGALAALTAHGDPVVADRT